jgi:DNA-binding LacI/PurR family transcriptional regulator
MIKFQMTGSVSGSGSERPAGSRSDGCRGCGIVEAMVTIKDVAKKARVGISTVSRVLNDHPDVGDDTRHKILKVAKELGYRPNSRARQLVRDTTETICFVMSNRDMISQFHSKILFGVEAYARSVSQSVLFMRFDYSQATPQEELVLPRILWETGTVDGVIIAGTNYPNFVGAVRSLGIPFVLFGNNVIGRLPMSDMDVIWFDVEGGVRQTADYLFELGHKDIWYLGDLKLPWYRRGYRAYEAAMEERSLTPRMLEMEWKGPLFDCGIQAADSLAERLDKVTAVIAGDDEIALGVLTGLARRGIKVPEDISLAGFDDIEDIKYVDPPLTTVRVPKELIGEDLARVLFERLSKPASPAVRRVVPTELVVRQSCSSPRAQGTSAYPGDPQDPGSNRG